MTPGQTQLEAFRLVQAGRPGEALTLLDALLARDPGAADAWVNHGNILSLMGRSAEALASYDRALALAPDADTFNNRGHVLEMLMKPAGALASYEAALALQPANIQALFRRGVLLNEMGRFDEAMDSYDRLLAFSPNHAQALNNRGFIWWLNRNDPSRALADLTRAFTLAPGMPYLRGAIMHIRMYGADWTGFDAEKAALAQGIRAGAKVARPFMLQAVSDDPAQLQACARLYARDLYPPVPAPPHAPRRPEAKIRLGYLSGEFREQATAILMAGLYERHDRSRFEIVAIDNGVTDNGAMRTRLEKAFDRWVDISALSDDDAAARIRAAGVDILVNLNGYFGRHRMGVFARRPAPIQVNYLGFPATLGAPYMDYIIADAVVIPPDETHFYDERVVTLPGSYQVNDDRGRVMALAPTRQAAGLPDTGFVFCNFNQSYKLTPDTFAGWMRILKQVDGSVLWLLAAAPPFAANLARAAAAQGVDPARILFAPDRPPTEHLARLSLADLFLDGLPYNAHTTASDALWAGVPVLTRRGTAFPGRVAASLLTVAGLPGLITESQAEYEALAVRLARDPAALKVLRPSRTSPLFDTDLVRRRIEKAYEEMWRRWLAGEPPRAFTLSAAEC
jgi:predicted O-linked N-acetylglucosamine transferase (SPINDLY family)